MKKECREMVKNCLDCQKSKITRHVSTVPGTFTPPSNRFENVHVDIVVMPYCEGYRYLSFWDSATHYDGPRKQIESHLFRELNALTGTTHLRTTVYHPESNGIVERLHRQLKAAIKCHRTAKWTETLSTVMLGIRSAWKDDLQSTAAEMVYGEPLRLSGEFLAKTTLETSTTSVFVQQLRQHVRQLQPVHGKRTPFIFKDLATTSQVFVCHDGPKGSLQQPYDGPFKVVSRTEKTFVVCIRGKNVKIAINCQKPAYVVADLEDYNTYDERTIEI
ncbi:uncharacterized protein LOC108736574 [Agrilus planipennis]|uniref:Uncharacterized protein LOC108736574 n=1 Tax=Agrilus planipennis TaxID=224129 RepID=A0A1W4WVK5_AGRPL|nr:uncharacterized protein LOC108736574 [Agrilus planipennis]